MRNLATSGPESLWQYVFFDLDGTVTASHMGIIRSVQYALRQMGRPVPEAEALMPLIGPPLQESFGKLLGGDPDLAREATRLYREYYTVTGIYENKVYDGVEDLLRTLQEAGRMLCLATSKPEPFARRILQHFGLDGYFSQVAGAELDGRRTGKTEVLRYAAALCRPRVLWWATANMMWRVRTAWAWPVRACSTATAAVKSCRKPARTGFARTRPVCVSWCWGAEAGGVVGSAAPVPSARTRAAENGRIPARRNAWRR